MDINLRKVDLVGVGFWTEDLTVSSMERDFRGAFSGLIVFYTITRHRLSEPVSSIAVIIMD